MIKFLNKILNKVFKTYWELKYYLNFSDISKIKVYKPIFFIGTNGSGLTLITRILRRDRRIVSSTGNYKYWAGRDELHNVHFKSLPENLRFGMSRRHTKEMQADDFFGYDLGWGFATNKLKSKFRRDKKDLNLLDDQKFINVIKKIISTYKVVDNVRFVDKSQSYSLKVPLIRLLIPDSMFIIVARNPYIMVLREATNENATKKLKKKTTFNERLIIYAEAWKNIYETSLNDLDGDCLVLKLEDFIIDPKNYIKKIAEYIGLINIDIKKIMPQSNSEIPFGSVSEEKWYPINNDINSKYFNLITPEVADIIHSVVGPTAKRLGYDKPK